MLSPTSPPPPPMAAGSRRRRRHGWELPLHPLQLAISAIFAALATTFYLFLAPLLGPPLAVDTLLSLFSFTAGSAALMYIRCTWTDPSDRTHAKKQRRAGRPPKMNYGFLFRQLGLRLIRRIESRILSCCIRRRYLDSGVHLEPLLPFPFADATQAVSPLRKEAEQASYCLICDCEVKLRSKHCKSCNRCVDGFDHHCKWLNNCVGRKNYTTFILLMVFTLLMLVVEGGSAVAVAVRCFADSSAVKREMRERLHFVVPRGAVAGIAMAAVAFTAYSAAALGQLFFFHVVLIRKGMRTYDYILAMREAQSSFNPFDDDEDSSSDESFDPADPPVRPSFLSRFLCRRKRDDADRRISIRIDGKAGEAPAAVAIDPWVLIKMSKEKAMEAAERARERIQEKLHSLSPLPPMRPLPVETKQGPLMMSSKRDAEGKRERAWESPPLGRLSSPRMRRGISESPTPRERRHSKYRASFDVKLAEVSTELETHISSQMLCSVLASRSSAPDAVDVSPPPP